MSRQTGHIPPSGSTSQLTSGNGTSSLTITGFEVTIDGRYLSGPGFMFYNLAGFTVAPGGPNSGFRPYMKGGLIPTSYSIQQGSAEIANLAFTMDSDGNFTYDDDLDIMNGGPLRGQQTAYLEILGIPVLIDTRAAGVTSIVVVGNNLSVPTTACCLPISCPTPTIWNSTGTKPAASPSGNPVKLN